MNQLPDFLKQGEPARLFPVLADTNKEQRIASILLAALPQIPALATELFRTAGIRIGKRSKIETFTEVVLKETKPSSCRPDGLIVVSTPKSTWTSLVEAKIGKAELNQEQIERYLNLAKANGIDAVITLSNQFVARADHPPVPVSKTLLRKTELFHWSWTWIATQCEILDYQQAVDDEEQLFLLEELTRFLNHSGTGVERFTQMGKDWKDLVMAVANQEKLKKTGEDVEDAVGCWYAEERDLSLQLSRHVGHPVKAKIERKLVDDPNQRLKQGISELVDTHRLQSTFLVPDSAADLDVCADLARKTITVSMKLKAPQDRKSTKARVNWLLRMLKKDDPRLLIRAYWPGRAPFTQKDIAAVREDPTALQTDNDKSTPHSFEVLLVEGLGKRFNGRRTFIEDLERLVPEFYDLVGQHLHAWQPKPPKPVARKPKEPVEAIPDDSSDEQEVHDTGT